MQYSIFDGLEKEQIDSILPLMGHEVFDAGTEIIVEEGHNDKIHFILEGHVIVVKNGTILMELKKGAVFGEMEVLDVMPVEATVKAIATTKVMTLSIAALGQLFDTDLAAFSFILMNLARDLSRRLRLMNIQIMDKDESPPTEWS